MGWEPTAEEWSFIFSLVLSHHVTGSQPDSHPFLQMCGIGSIDVKDWKQNTVYKGDYHPNHIVIQWFWRVVLSFNNELRSRLLQVGVKICVIKTGSINSNFPRTRSS